MDLESAPEILVCQTLVRRSDIGSEARAATYAFLLCATRSADSSAPSRRRSARLRRSFALHRLPIDTIQHIARFAFEPRYVADFKRDPRKSWCVDLQQIEALGCLVSDLALTCVSFHGCQALDRLSLARPIVNSRAFVEFTLSKAWYGTSIVCQYAKNKMMTMSLFCDEEEDGTLISEHAVSIAVDNRRFKVPCFDGDWEWVLDDVTIGLLVDTIRGCVTFRLNDCDDQLTLKLPGSDWRQTGITLHACGFPDQASLEGAPMEVAVSSPPSSLVCASVPKSVDEHMDDGSLEYLGPDDLEDMSGLEAEIRDS